MQALAASPFNRQGSRTKGFAPSGNIVVFTSHFGQLKYGLGDLRG